VRFELLAGVREKEVDALEQFFSAISWVPVGEEVARAAYEAQAPVRIAGAAQV
jgi:predicted nucleic acid-binding protein